MSPTAKQESVHQALMRQVLIGEAGVDDVIFVRVDMCVNASDVGLKRETYYTPDHWLEAIQTCEDTSYKSWVYLVNIETDEILLLRKFL